ncbi:MAG TPA: hypothetical protein VF331_21460, partial [Polyangiales bacterium]
YASPVPQDSHFGDCEIGASAYQSFRGPSVDQHGDTLLCRCRIRLCKQTELKRACSFGSAGR